MIAQDQTVTVSAELREDKAKKLKGKDIIPAVVYGEGIKKNISISLPQKDFLKIYKEVGKGSLIKLDIQKDKERDAIIQAVQSHPVNGNIIHADFLTVDLNKEIEVNVTLEYTGESPLVKEAGGTLSKNAETILVKCKAKDIPDNIEVNTTLLQSFDDVLYLKDLNIPDNIEVLDNPETVIATVSEPISEEEMAKLEEEDKVEVEEVEGVTKEEETEEGEEGEEKPQDESKEESKEDSNKEEAKKE